MKITKDNYFEIKKDMKGFLNNEIDVAILEHNGKQQLARDLGFCDKQIFMILKRQSFSALERLVKKIWGIK